MTEISQRCFACAPVLGRLVKPHVVDACPLIRGRYCGMCASYGHTPSNCPDVTTRSFREPQFVEQLIPPSLMEKHRIITKTLLNPASAVGKGDWLMEVPDTDEGLRAALMAAGVKPMICQGNGRSTGKEITENKQRLQKVATAAGRKLVFIPDPSRYASDQENSAPAAGAQQQKEGAAKKAARRE